MIKRNMMQYCSDVRDAILTVVERAYLINAPEKKIFPYVVFEVRAIGDSRLLIECDIWDKKENEVDLQNTADLLESVLDGYLIANEFHSSMVTTNSDMKWVADNDETLIRINMSFNATYQA